MIVRVEFDKVKNKGILACDCLRHVREHFSISNPQKFQKKLYGGNIPDRKYIISPTGRFDVGLFPNIKKFIDSEISDSVKYILSDEFKRILFPSIKNLNILNVPCRTFELRDYQRESLERGILYGRGIFKLATSAGKTLVMSSLLESLYHEDKDFRGVVVVPDLGLVNQTFGDFSTYECSFSYCKWTGEEDTPDLNCNVIIVNMANFGCKQRDKLTRYELDLYREVIKYQNLNFRQVYERIEKTEELKLYIQKKCKAKIKQFKLKNKDGAFLNRLCKKIENYSKNKEILQEIYTRDFVIVDECHKVTENGELSSILDNFVTNNKFGFTGSLSKNDIDLWTCIGKFGNVFYEKSSKELRDIDILTNAEVVNLHIKYKKGIEYVKNLEGFIDPPKYQQEVTFVNFNKFRKSVICGICKKYTENVLIMVERLDYGDELLASLRGLSDKKVFFVNGEMPVDEREKIKKMMEVENNIICIAMSKIFSTGISINNIHYIIFTQMGKSFIKVVQSIGRGLRKHKDKQKLLIFDISDELEYSVKHREERFGIYEEECFNYSVKNIIEL